MHLVSPALPIGAYAYSQGQEYAIDSEWLRSDRDVQDWIEGILCQAIARLDLPCILRLYRAWQNNEYSQVRYWNEFVIASRETHELLQEDLLLGEALQRLLISVHEIEATKLITKPTYLTMFALAGTQFSVPERELLIGYCWSWSENQVAAATKTLPLGQTQAQKILVQMQSKISSTVDLAFNINDDEIGSGLPALAISSCRHERQYSRLFRS